MRQLILVSAILAGTSMSLYEMYSFLRGARPSGGDGEPGVALPPPALDLELLASEAAPPPMLPVLDEHDEEEVDDDDEAADVCFLYLCRRGPSLAAVGLFRDLMRAPL